MPASRVAVVTGATGFIGSWLCRVLAEDGVKVRALGRRADPPPLPAGAVYYRADLLDESGLRRAMAGADTVIHLAARVHLMHDPSGNPLAEFRRINVTGTESLLRQAIEAGASRFVFASTVKVMGDSGSRPFTEDMVPAPPDAYAVSKLEAETAVRAMVATHPIAATILRLPVLYGPGMKANMLRLFQLVDSGMPLPFGLVRNRRSLLFVGNAAEAFRAVLASPVAAKRTFLVSDGRDVSTPELVRLIGEVLGRRVRLLPVPPAMFRAAGRLGDLVSRVVPVPLGSAAVERLLGTLAVDSSALASLTGFRPPFTLEEGLRITADWFRGVRAGHR